MVNSHSEAIQAEVASGSSAVSVVVEPISGSSFPSPSQALLQQVRSFERTIVVTHNNPDPDAIAAGWAIYHLIRERVGHPVRLVAGGRVLRAENRQMLELLEPPLELLHQLTVSEPAAIVLVDCGIRATHHLLAGTSQLPLAVLDHHVLQEDGCVPFADIRPSVAATATIAASYLLAESVEPGEKLATALIYALKTETRGAETGHSDLDRQMLTWLTPRANPETLAQIENAPLRRNYYSDLVLALQNTFLYDHTAFCLLPQAEAPEIVAEVADLLVRGEAVDRVFCGAVIAGDLLVSVRTGKNAGNATELLQKTLAGLGQGGGHDHRAGGKVPGLCLGERLPQEIVDDLKSRWLNACGVSRQRATRLVPRREIVKHLG